VIGVPVPSKHLNGLDSLLSIVQMPYGIPVATVAIGNARNAALLAIRILSIKYPELAQKMKDFMERMKQEVLSTELPEA
jgi:5-(carboxyamino)imidazole ribonucleotide mutase